MTINSKVKTLYLFPANHSFINKKLSDFSSHNNLVWFYLGKNYFNLQTIASSLDKKGSRIKCSGMLQEIAQMYRQDYIDYIGQLNANQESPWWWSTSLSEKNPYISDVFLHFCYLKLALHCINLFSEDLIIVGESSALLSSIFVNASQKRSIKIIFYKSPFADECKALYDLGSNMIITGVNAVKTLTRFFQSRMYGRLVKKKRQIEVDKPIIMLHSWTDERSFSDPCGYTNIYLGDLGHEMQEKGYIIAYFAQVLPTIPYSRAIKELINRPEKILLFEEFISIPDIIRSLFFHRNIQISLSKIPDWAGLNVDDIILEEFNNIQNGIRSKQSYLVYCAASRLKGRFSISNFIYPFENHIWEKMLCMGLRERNPKILLTGYAHSVVNLMYTAYSVSSLEIHKIPLPNRIIVNGKRSKDILITSGFCGKVIDIAGAVRYMDTQNKNRTRLLRYNDDIIILVALPAGVSESLELILKIVQAFAYETDIQIIIKPHPISPIIQLQKFIPAFPSHIIINNTPVNQLLEKTNLLIYTDTTTSIEALSWGIPVMHIKSDLNIDINPLEGYLDIPSVSGPEEICLVAKELIHGWSENQEKYWRIASDFFEPLHKNFVEIFIQNPDEALPQT
jgi:hypothetical protein